MSETLAGGIIALLCEARQAEREQTRFYRALASHAESSGDAETAERLNELLADEQHHFSRLSARLLELEHTCAEPDGAFTLPAPKDWEPVAREREAAEIARYDALLASPLDGKTRALLVEIRSTELKHHAQLGGKWMPA